MSVRLSSCRTEWLVMATLALVAAAATPTHAQIKDVVVGFTPGCPYGVRPCYGGAKEALQRLDGVEAVADLPDEYNSTADVELKKPTLPDPGRWAEQFRSVVGENHAFRGIEVTIEGTVRKGQNGLLLEAPGVEKPLPLARLEHKVQWNFRKQAARQPEPDEQRAYETLAGLVRGDGELRTVQVTGPLRSTERGLVLEVREFFRQNLGEAPAYDRAEGASTNEQSSR